MGVSTNIRDRLIAIEKTMVYDGANVKAALYIPENIQPFQLPLFINFPKGGARSRREDTAFIIERTWTLRLIGRKEGDGGRNENEDRMFDLIDLTYDLFLPRQRLELSGRGLDNIASVSLTGDSGIVLSRYPTGSQDHASFYSVDFNMSVSYWSMCI